MAMPAVMGVRVITSVVVLVVVVVIVLVIVIVRVFSVGHGCLLSANLSNGQQLSSYYETGRSGVGKRKRMPPPSYNADFANKM
jgi:NADH:ubiquinone oxidoreductase subunit 3 (subunit A)